MNIRALIPWWVKFYLKIIITHLPVYKLFAIFNISKHGLMDSSDYARGVFKSHFQGFSKGEETENSSLKFLELGCGDSLASGIIGYYYGFSSSILVDSGNYENASLEFYKKLIVDLNKEHNRNEPHDFQTKAELLKHFKVSYLANGFRSLKELSSSDIDFIFSHAVLEHVFKSEFGPIMEEFHRILKPSGYMSHTVDFKDHLASSLNNLRFSPQFWESKLIRNSLAYTNRIRPSEAVRLVESAGFNVSSLTKQKWERLPLDKKKFHEAFQSFSEDDLITNGITIKCVKFNVL